MKLIYFIVIVIVIYVVASQIKVIHFEKLPTEQKQEVNNRSKVRSMLMNNYIKEPINGTNLRSTISPSAKFLDNKLIGLSNKYSSEQFQSTDYTRNNQDLTGGSIILPNASNLLFLIKSEYVDDQYKFNIATQPVTTRNSNRTTMIQDKKYLRQIKKDMEGWNELFYKYFQTNQKLLAVRELKPIFVTETTNEFVIKLSASVIYLSRPTHFQLTYYGQIEKSNEFLNNFGPADTYILQLVDIRPIPKNDFDIIPAAFNGSDNGPFMSMQEQMKYVDRVNRMHKNDQDLD